MKKKGKTKQQILFEEKTKPFLNDYSVQVQDEIERKKIKEAIRKIADAAEERTLIDVLANFLGEMIELKLAKKIE